LENPEELTVHVLRHSFGTQLAECGASVYEIRDLMGHSSIVVSENYVKLASNQGRLAHQKAFGGRVHRASLNMSKDEGIVKVLRLFRARLRRGWKQTSKET
jgi:predicted transcriptional regulator